MQVIMFPGQGSQYKGMGKDLFGDYPHLVAKASELLGYDLVELCLEDPEKKLGNTRFTQPVLYVVNALGFYRRQQDCRPNYLAGHSLGEYNALLAAGVFDFETGLRLVQRRGELMAAASGGGMAAVVGLTASELQQKLEQEGFADIDIANFNTPVQTVIAGQQDSLDRLVKNFRAQRIRIVPLAVSAPFHSRFMRPAAEKFELFLQQFRFASPKIPVIANATGRPYENRGVAAMLSRQIAGSVRWTDTIHYLLEQGVEQFEEIGGTVLTKMVKEIRDNLTPHSSTRGATLQDPSLGQNKMETEDASQKPDLALRLGSEAFRKDYGLAYAYLAGGMYRGIASAEMVIRMGKAGLLGFLGTAGLSPENIGRDLALIQQQLARGEAYGMNLVHQFSDPVLEMKIVEMALEREIRNVEAAAFMQITPALVYYRLKGLKRKEGRVVCDNRIIAKISRPEVAEAFMSPAPQKLIDDLYGRRMITADQAELARHVPMSHDICVEADSGGHTDGGVALVLLPAIQKLRQDICARHNYEKPIRIGLAGGIGTPQAVACAFVMGADFVLTGSINQCTAEAGTSEAVKDLLQEINIQDTDYAPAGDMFELGAKVQVLKKGVLFPARANRLYALYNQYGSLEEIPDSIVQQLEKSYFKKDIATIWKETREYLQAKGDHGSIQKAEQNARTRMALVLRWYFGYSSRLALKGDLNDKVNFQVHTGPALGAFNQWVKGTELENWRNRHADEIGILLMKEAAKLLKDSLSRMNN